MELTIIIVNWNGGEDLRRCLTSLHRAGQKYSFRVILVDNNSSDGSREMAEREFPGFQVINSGANLGFARGNNLARKLVDTPYVLLLNPDTEVHPETLPVMVEFLRANPEVGAVTSKIRSSDGSVQELGLQWFPSPWTEFLGLVLMSGATFKWFAKMMPTVDPATSGYVRKLYGGCIMARRKALDQVGWLDERYFMYAEDVDLCRTFVDHGWKLYYLSEAEIIHDGGATSSKAPSGFSILMKCESIGKLMTKYYGFAGHALYRLAICAGASIRLVLVSVFNLVKILTARGRDQSELGSIRKCWLMLSWSVGLRKAAVPSAPVSGGAGLAA